MLQSKESLTVLVVGKGGVGKSSTVNSIVGERVTVVSAFQVTWMSWLTLIFRCCCNVVATDELKMPFS